MDAAPSARRQPPSFRAQIALVFGALCVLVASLLSLAFGELLRAQIQRSAGVALYTVAGNASALLAEGLFERSREVQVLTQSEALWKEGLESHTVREMLARSQAIQPNSLWIGVADEQGVVRAATGGLLVGQSVKERPWFAAGLQGLHVGDVHPAKLLASLLAPSGSGGEPLRFVDFSAPIRVDGRTLGVLGVHGSWDWTREVIERLMPPKAQEDRMALFIFDRRGDLIYAPDGKTEALKASGQRLPLPPRRGLAELHDAEVEVVRWLDGENYLTAVVRVEPRSAASDLGWQIVARQPVAIAFAEADLAVRRSMVLGVAAALLAAMLAWFAAQRLSTELYTLGRAAREVEAGKPGAQIPLSNGNREVRNLSESLASMTRRLLAANEEMEQQVRRRTAELESANRELDRQARTDALTGLLNRRGMDDRLKAAISLAQRGKRPLSAIVFDVDYFKRINDTFGHDIGDVVLKRLGQTLQQRLRDSDAVARMGGEEFLALLPDTDRHGALAVAEQIVRTVEAQEDAVVGRVTISAGVAWLRGDGDEAAAVLRRADEALYEAKGQGRNRVCCLE